MAEIIFPSEVRELAQVDWENPLSDYLVSAMLPNIGSGNNLVDVVSGGSQPINGGSIIWNADWSIIGGEGANDLRVATFKDNTFQMDLLRDEFIVMLDVERSAASNGGDGRSTLFSTEGGTSTQNSILVEEQQYSLGLKFIVRRSNSTKNLYINNMGTGRQVHHMHWRGAVGEFDLYTNGVLVSTLTGASTSDNDGLTKSLQMGVGSDTSSQYGQAFYLKRGGTFTQEEIDSVITNPYQLFKTREKVVNEYGLVCATNQKVNAGAWNPTTLDFSFAFTFIAGSVTRNILGSDHTKGIYIRVDGNQQLYVWYNNKSLYSVSKAYTFTNGIEYTIKGIVYANGDSEVRVDDLVFYTATNSIVLGNAADLTTINYTDFAPTEYSNFTALLLVLNDTSDSTNSRYWEFNQTHGEQVVDHYNGSIATLVGFSEDSGYVRGTSGLIEGYQTQQDTPNGFQFRGLPVNPLTIKIYATGDFNNIYNNSSNWTALYDGRVVSGSGYLYLTTSNATEPLGNGAIQGITNASLNGVDVSAEIAAGVGVGKLFHAKAGDLIQFDATGHLGNFNLMMSNTGVSSCNGIIGKVEVFDGAVLVANYDFTTGDQGKIIETISGNHAVITNAATDKWQPIVPVDVFTDADYVDVVSFGTARGSSNNLQHYKFSGTQLLTGDFDHRTDFVGGYVIEGTGSAFVGDFSDLTVATIKHDPSYTGWLFDDRTGRGLVKNIIVDGGNNITWYSGSNLPALSSVGITSENAGGALYNIGTLDLIIKDSVIYSNSTYALYNINGTVKATNSQFNSSFTSIYGGLRLRDCESNLINCTSDNTIGTAIGISGTTVLTGSNNLSSDSSATDLGIGTGSVDFTGAFADSTIGDYRINQAWADTNLVGKGWNNSDIVSWAYYTAIALLIEGTITDGNNHSVDVYGTKVTVGSTTDGTITVTLTNLSSVLGAKTGKGFTSSTSYTGVTSTEGNKEASSSLVNSITLSYNNTGNKVGEGTSLLDITELISTGGIKDTSGTISDPLGIIEAAKGLKIADSIIAETATIIETITNSYKIGISSIEETISSLVTNNATKYGDGTIGLTHAIIDTTTGFKIVAGTAQGTITIDIASDSSILGAKYADGTLALSQVTDIILNTLKLAEGQLDNLLSYSDSTDGAKIANGSTISAHTIIDIIESGKVGDGSFILVNVSGDIQVQGSKTGLGNISSDNSLLIALQAEAIKQGNVDVATSIDIILTGNDLDKSHIRKLGVILGTLTSRFEPIIGISTDNTITGEL